MGDFFDWLVQLQTEPSKSNSIQKLRSDMQTTHESDMYKKTNDKGDAYYDLS